MENSYTSEKEGCCPYCGDTTGRHGMKKGTERKDIELLEAAYQAMALANSAIRDLAAFPDNAFMAEMAFDMIPDGVKIENKLNRMLSLALV